MTQTKKLIIISACASQKSHTPHETCHLDACVKESPTLTAKEWILRVQDSKLRKCPAEKLYMGSHWKETIACVKAAADKGLAPELFVLSAGWGLVPAKAEISSYSATFSSGKDSIDNIQWPRGYTPKERAQEWWKALNRMREMATPRSLAELPAFFKESRKLIFLLILSKEYYQAIEPEIIELVSKGHDVIIVSAGLYSEISSVNPLVRDHILPVSDKFKQADEYLNKSNTSLNARLAKWLVVKHCKDLKKGLSALHEIFLKMEKSLPKMQRREVVRMADEEVLHFIKKNISSVNNTATKLLRLLRDSEKKSCEQKRFGKLFGKHKNHREGDLFNGGKT